MNFFRSVMIISILSHVRVWTVRANIFEAELLKNIADCIFLDDETAFGVQGEDVLEQVRVLDEFLDENNPAQIILNANIGAFNCEEIENILWRTQLRLLDPRFLMYIPQESIRKMANLRPGSSVHKQDLKCIRMFYKINVECSRFILGCYLLTHLKKRGAKTCFEVNRELICKVGNRISLINEMEKNNYW